MLRIYVYEDLMFYQRYPLSIKLTESHECLDHGHAKAHECLAHGTPSRCPFFLRFYKRSDEDGDQPNRSDEDGDQPNVPFTSSDYHSPDVCGLPTRGFLANPLRVYTH